MKKCFSAFELLIIIIVLCVLCITCFKNSNPVKSTIHEHQQMKSKQEIIDNQLKEIQENKDIQDEKLKQSLEQIY